jgi:hypothetical protein
LGRTFFTSGKTEKKRKIPNEKQGGGRTKAHYTFRANLVQGGFIVRPKTEQEDIGVLIAERPEFVVIGLAESVPYIESVNSAINLWETQQQMMGNIHWQKQQPE